ncbi:response regulator receiver sensor signal transduction histidine kinase [Pseudoduganella flava]|uniref:histidine kinase n=1 Tax=Pseudoduganella flava TaxID=871742 RepID=A0A562PQS3_9BURK|nr:hybrid sensor histidine kinase/response regulator [Pseudoduganella flava]QGZ37872.1 response regulator [Pseudoduganella flava]TWI46703.1 response regulator receiver sensor signal transduction histidine kinase [Pseudoduganella flava]
MEATTVLYVDDEDLARKYFGRAFGSDYRVLTAPGVDAALALLAEHSVDVLVTDWRMPGRAGGELLREVERRRPGLVRILVTAYANKDVLLETVNGGDVFRVLEKPVPQDTLREVLRLACAEAARRARERAVREQGMLAVEETVAFLAHELGTPLASIADFAQTIARRVAERDDEGSPALLRARIGNAVAHMNDNARYCQSVLDAFVDTIKRAALAPAARVAADSAQRMVAALLAAYAMAPEQRDAIVVDVRHDFPIAAAPNCVALVLSALVGNALRALDGHPAPRLTVTVGVDERPVLAVSDNGPGIPSAILHRLLLDPVSMHGGAGHGWSLIFCNRVMQSFGGALRVQSKEGRGTTVTMNFPETQKEQA